jgi:hypothetical protein
VRVGLVEAPPAELQAEKERLAGLELAPVQEIAWSLQAASQPRALILAAALGQLSVRAGVRRPQSAPADY